MLSQPYTRFAGIIASVAIVVTVGRLSPLQGRQAQPDRLGEVVASMLTEPQFQLVYGPGWILADGRNVTGSPYHALTARSTVPDLRGMFLRGMNNGRTNGGNPVEIDLGVQQSDELGRHAHTTVQMLLDNTVDGVDSTTFPSAEHHNEQRSTGAAGGDETRPKNVTVNFFIRIS